MGASGKQVSLASALAGGGELRELDSKVKSKQGWDLL